MAFFLQLHFMLISQHFYGLFYHLIFRDISLKSQELSVLFLVTFQWILSWLIFFVELSHLAIRFIIRLFIRYYSFIYSYISLFGFSISLFLFLILSSCLAVLIYLFISYSLFLLNCANSVLCAV